MNRSIRNLSLVQISFVFMAMILSTTSSIVGQTSQSGFNVPVETEAVTPAAIPTNEVVTSKRLTDVIHNGGPLMIAIAVCSFILVMFSFERLISLRKGRILPGPFVKRFLEQLREGELTRDSAISLCEKTTVRSLKSFELGYPNGDALQSKSNNRFSMPENDSQITCENICESLTAWPPSPHCWVCWEPS